MIALDLQQSERISKLVELGGFQSENELLNAMISEFEYQLKVRQLRKAVNDGLKSGEPVVIDNTAAFLEGLMQKAEARAKVL